MTKPKLKPCPFCGEAPILDGKEVGTEYAHYSIYCDNVGGKCWMYEVSTGDYNSRAKAIATWNRRARGGGKREIQTPCKNHADVAG